MTISQTAERASRTHGPSKGKEASQAGSTDTGARIFLILLMCSMMIPASFYLGETMITFNRFAVLLAIIPLGFMWLGRKGGPITGPDMLIALHALWIMIAFMAVHGSSRLPYSIMLAVEMFGGYLAGRVLVRNVRAYRTIFATMIVFFIVLLPFALYETRTDHAIMQEYSRMLFGSSHGDVNYEPRWGFSRVQSVMQHPILFGVFCSIALANAYFIWRPHLFSALWRSGLTLFMAGLSLSSGALLACVAQLGIMFWGKITGGAWKALTAFSVFMYVFLSVASNRGPAILMIETLTFNSGTGWTRIHIWRNAKDDIMANPIFGIGLNDWSRPFWLTGSVDNFWLLTAMRFGLVGFALLALGLAWHILKVVRAQGLTNEQKRLRIAYLIGFVSLCFSLATVHVWGPTYVLFMLYAGAGAIFYQGTDQSSEEASEHEKDSRPSAGRSFALPRTRDRQTPKPTAPLPDRTRLAAGRTEAYRPRRSR